MTKPCILVLLRVVLASCFAACPSFAQTLTISEVARARDRVQRSPGVSEAERVQILAQYDRAIESLQEVIRFKGLELGYTRTRASVEQEKVSLTESFRQAQAAPPPPVSPEETARQVEDALEQAQLERLARETALEDISQVAVALTKRREAIGKRRTAARGELDALDDQIAALELTPLTREMADASRVELRARKQSLQEEMISLAAERELIENRRLLLPLQREMAKLRLEAASRNIQALKQWALEVRKRDNLRELERIRTAAVNAAKQFPVLEEAAREVEQYAQRMYGSMSVLELEQRAAADTERARQQLARVSQIFQATRRRYEAAPFLASASDWLEQLPPDIPQPARIRLERLKLKAVVLRLKRDIITLDEVRSSEAALETQIQQLKDSAAAASRQFDAVRFESVARTLLQMRRALVEDLLQSGQELDQRLTQFDEATEKLLTEIQELNAFVSQRLLWTRSVSSEFVPSVFIALGGLRWFAANPDWPAVIKEVLTPRADYLWLLPAGLLAPFLLWRRPVFHAAIRHAADALTGARGGRFVPFRSALVNSVWLAAGWPLLLIWLSWVLGENSQFAIGRAVSAGLAGAARLLFALLFMREVLRDGGVADAHLGWPHSIRHSLQGQLLWLICALPPLYFIVSALAAEGGVLRGDAALQAYHSGLGRLCFIAMTACLILAARRALRPSGPQAFGPELASWQSASWLWRLGSGRNMTILGTVLLVAALAGFYLTALLAGQNLVRTAILTVALGFISALIFRWRQDQRTRVASPGGDSQARAANQAETQVRQLSRFGITLVWLAGAVWIWSAALPAFAFLRQVQLLPSFRFIDKADMIADSVQTQPPKSPEPAAQPAFPIAPAQPATLPVNKPQEQQAAASRLLLSDVALALFLGMIVSMVVRNIPGLLEFTVMRRFQLDAGGKYAISTIARYVVILLGVLLVSGALGISWASVQWLAAALTFGIGFGLQEIFANFASGLILLLDRSIRVGDAVSVGELSGRVSRIEMRATTITLWDRSDMVVPNKEFITSKLVNWTLTHPETRVDVKVGVGYGSDVVLVKRVLLEIAHANTNVLEDPPPEVYLMEFADSAILFELRAYCLFEYGRLVLLDELHMEVVRRFQELGIVIAFPQLDVHLDPGASPGVNPTSGK
jgi:potassium efflux system protein